MRNKLSRIHPGSVLVYVFLSVFGFLCVAPFVYIISISVSTEVGLGKYGATFIPRTFTLDAYAFILQYGDRFFKAFGVSAFLATIGTFMSVLATAALAYPLSRKYLPYRTTVMKGVFFTMLFNGGIIPFYLIVKQLGLYNSIWSLVLPVLINAYYMILMRNFFMTIPESMEESALCDGANDLQIFFRIILPTSKTILATIALFYAVGNWNSWFIAMLFISDADKYPAMLFLRGVLYNFSNPANAIMTNTFYMKPPSEALRMACVVVITTPILLSYPFAQKYFVKGIMIGSVKG